MMMMMDRVHTLLIQFPLLLFLTPEIWKLPLDHYYFFIYIFDAPEVYHGSPGRLIEKQ